MFDFYSPEFSRCMHCERFVHQTNKEEKNAQTRREKQTNNKGGEIRRVIEGEEISQLISK